MASPTLAPVARWYSPGLTTAPVTSIDDLGADLPRLGRLRRRPRLRPPDPSTVEPPEPPIASTSATPPISRAPTSAAAAMRTFGEASATPLVRRCRRPALRCGAGSDRGLIEDTPRRRRLVHRWASIRRFGRANADARRAARPAARRVVDGRLGVPEGERSRPSGHFVGRDRRARTLRTTAYLRLISGPELAPKRPTACRPTSGATSAPSTPRPNTSSRSRPHDDDAGVDPRIELAAERFPLVPVRAIPVAVPELAIRRRSRRPPSRPRPR